MVAFTRKNTPEVAEADRRGFAKFRFGAEWPNDFTKEATYIRGVRSSLGQKERKEARICCVFISVSEQNRSVGLPVSSRKYDYNSTGNRFGFPFFFFISFSPLSKTRILFALERVNGKVATLRITLTRRPKKKRKAVNMYEVFHY